MDIQQLAGALMKGEVEGGAERSSGLVYHRDMDIEINIETDMLFQRLKRSRLSPENLTCEVLLVVS